MKITYCDICEMPIEIKDKKYLLAFSEVIEEGRKKGEQLIEQINNHQRYYTCNIKVHEICLGCQKVLNNFFIIRKNELKKIASDLEKMMKDRGSQK